MALISPGVDVSVIDESQYAPSGGGTVPYLLIATAQDKVSGTGTGVAEGTTKANGDKISIVTSQRELVSLYGNPIFQRTSTGTPIHGSELNEYGLMTAYSLLGVTNRVYVQRADINMNELVGTNVRPTSNPQDGTYWFDVSSTTWGMFEWNASTQSFASVKPIVIDDALFLTIGGVPLDSVGAIGSYAVVVTNTANPVYYKNNNNDWVLVGSLEWQQSHYAVQSTNLDLSNIAANSDTININGIDIKLTGTTAAFIAGNINASGVAGVTAADVGGKLEIYVTTEAASDGLNPDGLMVISNKVGTPLSLLGIAPGIYAGPAVEITPHTQVPRWKANDNVPRPTGSLWSKVTSANLGADFVISRYSSAVDSFSAIAAPLYASDEAALKGLDPTGGGLNITAGALYVQFDVLRNKTLTYKILKRAKQGVTTVTGVSSPVFYAGDKFKISASLTGVNTVSDPITVTISNNTPAGFVQSVLAANIPNITAQVTASGAVSITHTKGGIFYMQDVEGSPLAGAGFVAGAKFIRAATDNVGETRIVASNFEEFYYTASIATPNSDPESGRMWYYSEVGEVDIMIHDGSKWVGYKNGGTDARGYNLSLTYDNGPIISASKPIARPDGTLLEFGDLWVDTGDLENFPVIYRWSNVGGSKKWVLIDNTDQTTENGIVFADARWDTDGTRNVVVGDIVPIQTLLTSDYVDLDAPDPDLYPRGTLLFNTRRSSFNVKRYVKNYFNDDSFVGELPDERDAWVSAAGNKDDGSPYMGRQSVRQVVVVAMKAAISASTELREEQRNFTLIACPGYPELIPNMVALNNDRKNTAFIVGDTPLRLRAKAGDIQDWANDVYKKGTGEFGLSTSDPYLAVYYPSAQTNDLDGNTIVMPASHVALRTIIRSDNVSYPWFAAAGVRRGLVDNATSVGYIDPDTGEFVTIGVTEGLRDTLYENRINPITYLTGVGLVVYGNKSLGVAGSALDRINVSRLVVYLRKVVDAASRNFVFEPNDKITRDEIKQVIERALNDLIAKRALLDYVVVCDESNNTPIRRDRNEMYVDVAIEPVKSAEFIYIPLRIKAQGVLSGT